MASLRENVKPDPCPEYCCTKFGEKNDLFMLNRNFSVVMTANRFENFVNFLSFYMSISNLTLTHDWDPLRSKMVLDEGILEVQESNLLDLH